MKAGTMWSWMAMILGLLLVGAHIDPQEKDYTLKDGRTVHCLVQPSMFARAISCDWASAKVRP